MKNRFVKTLLAGLATAVIATSASWAQAPGGQGGPGGRGGFGLDEQQRTALNEALDKNKDEITKLQEKLTAAQKELLKVVLAEKYDEKAVREKADAVAKIQTDLLMLRSKAFATLAPSMKPEQKEQIIDSRFGFMMLSGGFGGGMRGPGAPGGFGGQGGQGGRGNRGGQGGGQGGGQRN